MNNKLKLGIILMMMSSLLTVIGQLLWDFGKSASDTNDFILIFIGFALYGLGSLLMIYSFRCGDLSILYPVMGTSYVFAIIIGRLVLNENINTSSIIGTAFILLGISFIGRGEAEND